MTTRIVGARRLLLPDAFDEARSLDTLGARPEHTSTRWTSVVHDDADLRLTRSGIAVERQRSGRAAHRWTVRLPVVPSPERPSGPLVACDWPDPGPTIPPALWRAVGPLLAGPVGPVAELVTSSATVRLGGSAAGVTLVVDTIELREGRRTVGRLRVLDVSPTDTTPLTVLDGVEAALRRAGATDLAGPGPAAVLLGAAACRPHALAPVPVDRASTAADVVRATLRSDAALLAHHWPLLHLAPSVRSVHSGRVALRRLRSHLRLFEPLLEVDAVTATVPRVRALAALLGTVRELDVLADLVATVGSRLDDHDAKGIAALLDAIDRRRSVAGVDLADALEEADLGDTMRLVIALAIEPPVSSRGDEPARRVVTDLVQPPWQRLHRAAGRLRDDSPVDDLHSLRLLAKRARYAADVAGRVRPAAARHALELRRLQRLLGELNDGAVADRQLRTLAVEEDDGELGFTAGLVTGELRRREQRVRAAWPDQWERTTRKGVRGWLDRS